MRERKDNFPLSSDEEIITSYKNNDQEALKIIIERYTSSLFNFAARLANKNDAPDIVQEIFIKIWKNINRESNY